MVLGHHLIVSTYGFWLPNDERGSWSDFVRSYELLVFGSATKVDTSRSVASRSYDPQRRRDVQQRLKYTPVLFDGMQARAVARGFAFRSRRSDIRVLACAIMPDHTHMVLQRHRMTVEMMTNQFKGAATHQLVDEGLHPFTAMRRQGESLPSVWAVGEWKVFLDSVADIERAVRYVNNNPLKAGHKAQRWDFVRP